MYESILVPAPGGGAEEFHVRIPKAAVLEWVKLRERFRAEGRPDRPPDVDTPLMRLWIAHPGEENDPYFEPDGRADKNLRSLLDPRPATFTCAVWIWRDARGSFQLQLAGHRDGTFGSVAITDPEGPIAERPLGKSGRLAWRLIEEQLALLCEQYGTPVSVVTYFDFVQVEEELRLAQADLDRGFISPLPEGRA